MYRCEITNKLSKPGEPLHKVVALTRPRVYTRWVRDEDDPTKWIEVEAGRGSEIVKELNCSQEGEAIWQSWSLAQREFYLLNMTHGNTQSGMIGR